MGEPRQLLLPFVHSTDFADDFLEAPSNRAALTWLARTGSWPGLRLALWGAGGCGKTHLLHLWARRIGARYVRGPSLEMERLSSGMAIDDADLLPDETVLLHTLNAAAEANVPILLAARQAPARWPVKLPDLSSRLRAISAVEIGAAEDSLLRLLFARLLAERQLKVPACVQDWLTLRLPRTPAAMREAAVRLDRASLASGRAVNRPMAASVLQAITGEPS
jgi:chromosomal replication initiation ATPase DnaA